MKVEFTKKGTVNGVSFKKGDTLKVSKSIRDRLVDVDKSAKDYSVTEDKKVQEE